MEEVNFKPLRNAKSRYHSYGSLEDEPLCLHIVKSIKHDTYFVFVEDAHDLDTEKSFRIMTEVEIAIEYGIVVN